MKVRRYQRRSIAAGQAGHDITAPFEYNGTMHGYFFEAWFEQHMLPELPDTASFHRKKRLNETAEKHMPPYPPELNPIKHFWHWLKKKAAGCLKFCSDLNIALSAALQEWIIKFTLF